MANQHEGTLKLGIENIISECKLVLYRTYMLGFNKQTVQKTNLFNNENIFQL